LDESCFQSSPEQKLKIKAQKVLRRNRKALKMVNIDELSKAQGNALKSTRFQNRSRSTLAIMAPGDTLTAGNASAGNPSRLQGYTDSLMASTGHDGAMY